MHEMRDEVFSQRLLKCALPLLHEVARDGRKNGSSHITPEGRTDEPLDWKMISGKTLIFFQNFVKSERRD